MAAVSVCVYVCESLKRVIKYRFDECQLAISSHIIRHFYPKCIRFNKSIRNYTHVDLLSLTQFPLIAFAVSCCHMHTNGFAKPSQPINRIFQMH